MSIFVDSCALDEIERLHRMGIIRGVTTNPTIMLRHGVMGVQGVATRARAIAQLIAPLPLSIEVTTPELSAAREQAKRYASWASNVNVKVTIHGPDGETENLELIHELETVHDIRVNVTAMMSAQQCLVAAYAGATYVSLFGGRVNNMGYNAVGEIARLRKLLDRTGLRAQIIVGSTREVLNVVEWLEAGAHIVTATPEIISAMILHPYTKETVRSFLEDAAKGEELTAPARPREVGAERASS